MTAESVLSEGFTLFRSFVSTMSSAPEDARGQVLLAFRPKFADFANRAESFLAANGGLGFTIDGQLRSAIVLARDGEDQSPKHPGSYLSRVTNYLQSANVNRPAGAAAAAMARINPMYLVVAVVVVLFFLMKGRR